MTRKKALKKRVRARQAKTGESYTTALSQVRRLRIEEAPSATAEARAEGFRCQAVVSAKLKAAGDLRPLFARLRGLLEALNADACGPLLRGERVPRRMPVMRDLAEARRFLRSGELGLSRDGRLFALWWDGRIVTGAILLVFREPLLQLGLLDEADWPSSLALAGIGR